MKHSAVLAAAMAMGLAFHAQAKTYTPVFTEDFENAATWHDNVQYGSVSNAYFNMATLDLGVTEYQLSQAERMLSDGVSTTKFYQQASDDNQKRNSAFIIPDSVLSGLGTDYVLEFDLGFNAPYAKNYSTDYCAGLSVNDANGLPLLTIGTVFGNGNGEKNTGYIYRRDDNIDDAIASGFRVTGRDGVITNSAYAKNWLHVKLAVSGSSMSVTATLADGTVLCSDAAVSADITSPVKYLGLRSWNNGNYNLARCGLDNISISKAIEGTFVWTGEAGDGRWFNPGNWQISDLSVASAPEAGDAVSISDATVAIDPAFDLSSVTATLSNAKIAVLFTDSALSYTVPTGFVAGDFVASGPYSVEVSDGVITATRIPSSFVWTPSAGNWADVANWTVGGLPTGVVPGTTDTAVFSDNATAVLSDDYNISNLVVATGKKLTLNGGMLVGIYEFGTETAKGGTVALNRSELRSCNVSNSSASWYGDIEIAGGTSVTNYIRATISTQGASGTLKLYGNLSGDGCVILYVEGHRSYGVPDGRGGVSLYGDNTDFEGICYIKSGASNRGPATFCSATAGSAKARWVYLDSANDNTGAMSGTIAVENSTIKLGTYEGKNYIFGCTGHTGNTIEIGGADTDFTCSLSARSAAAERANNSATLKKVGVGTMTFGEEVGNPCFNTYEMNGGVLKFANMYITKSATGQSSYINPTFTFTGGTLALDDCATNTVDESLLDLSPYIKNSTAAISVFVDEAQTMTWGTALAAQAVDAETGRDGGLTKLGAGTLTLSAAPKYTGWTTIKAGKLIVPAGTALDVVAGAGGEIAGATTNNLAFAEGYTFNTASDSTIVAKGAADVSNLKVYIENPTASGSFKVVKAGNITGKVTLESLEFPAGTSEKVKAKWSLKVSNGLLKASSISPMVFIIR